ncbi:MAG: tetratricopeptide repeat protein [Candidatus Omnitrophica bacterium]|nr:tetratricopeptide repeat protein [Candidatus Omnitrophota bacterium]MBU1128204.1 tetratricopeptide repeat protein [Candidatus Omnitrophota bacterium]
MKAGALAVAHGHLNREVEAIVAYKKAIEASPGFAGAYSNLGNGYSMIGVFENPAPA